jgi:hypothetical protein
MAHHHPTVTEVIYKIASIFGAVLVFMGILSILTALFGAGSSGVHTAKYLLILGGVILAGAQMMHRE